jgi:hypothetical protein
MRYNVIWGNPQETMHSRVFQDINKAEEFLGEVPLEKLLQVIVEN